MYTEEPRTQILNSTTNNSTSKQAWSFSKEKRFPTHLSNCPHVSYSNQSTISNRKSGFGKGTRKLFTETNEGPSSWMYKPRDRSQTATISFASGRHEVIANSYILRDPLYNPGPGQYTYGDSSRQGYSMRPKTANHRNYFIDDKEMTGVPGPGSYHDGTSEIAGRKTVSKFRSSTLGSSLTSKSKRFDLFNPKTPSSWEYNKGASNFIMGKNSGAKIGTEVRSAFTDKVAKSSFTPGPGKYRELTEFGHYGKI